ncbi:MAG: hypothetical protein AAF734_02040, partial [Bacteroidota bacterium]
MLLISSFTELQAQATADVATAAPELSTFALSPDEVGNGLSTVNLHTGDVNYPVNLVSLPQVNELGVNVSIAYSSNVQHLVDVWKKEAPTGILGLGWQLDLPKIVCDHKQTGTRDDDDFYLVEGGQSTKLVMTEYQGIACIYEPTSLAPWIIKYYPTDEKWTIIKENGFTYTYGDKTTTQKAVQWVIRWGNWIGNSNNTSHSDMQQMAYVWSLSSIENNYNQYIRFEYLTVEKEVGITNGKKHTEASYLKKITDVVGRQVVFNYSEKPTTTYQEPHMERAEPDAYQEVYERKYLNGLTVRSAQDSLLFSIEFDYTYVNSGEYTKQLLEKITQKSAQGNALPSLTFAYHTSGATKGMLQTVTLPTGGKLNYAYQTTSNSIGHSKRDLTVTAPAHYAEAYWWFQENYALVSWRRLASDNTTHTGGASNTRLQVYEWDGTWLTPPVLNVGNTYLEGDNYKNFFVVTEKNFFAVLKQVDDT